MKLRKQIAILICLYSSSALSMQRALQLAENNLTSAHYRVAAEKFREVADSDDAVARAQAQLRLGQMYSTGKGASVPKSTELALSYLKKAAKQNVNRSAKNKAAGLLKQLEEEQTSTSDESNNAPMIADTNPQENPRPAPILLPQDLLQRYQVQDDEIGDMPFFEPFDEEEKKHADTQDSLFSPSYTSRTESSTVQPSQRSSNQSEFNSSLQQADTYVSGVVSLPDSLELNPALRAAETYLDAGQYAFAAQKFKEVAASQDAFAAAEAEYRLAELYSNGQGVEKDQQQAVRLWRKVAAQKTNEVAKAWALAQLGDAYLHGTGVKQSKKEAERYFKRAQNIVPDDEELQLLIQESRQEEAPSMATIDAQLLQHLEDLRTSPAASPVAPRAASQIEQKENAEQQAPRPVLALPHFTNQPPAQVAPQTSRLRGYYERKLVSGTPAEKVHAQVVLGQMLIKGLLGPKDIERGKQLLREAAQQEAVNSSAARAAKDALYEPLSAQSEAKEQRSVQKERLTQSTSRDFSTVDDAHAFFDRGIKKFANRNFGEARQDFETALKITDNPILRAKALLNLGTLYDAGLKDSIKARDYWDAVIHENADPVTTAAAQLYLGMLYEYGGRGVTADWPEASRLFKMVVKQKDNMEARASALFAVADMYYHSPQFYEYFEPVFQYLNKAATQTDNREVASRAQALLKEVLDYAAHQNENLAVQQQARRYLMPQAQQANIAIQKEPVPSIIISEGSALTGTKRKAPEMSSLVRQRAKTSHDELSADLNAASTLAQLSTSAMKIEKPSLHGAINLLSAGRTKEALAELENVIERGDEDEKVQAYALLQNFKQR